MATGLQTPYLAWYDRIVRNKVILKSLNYNLTIPLPVRVIVYKSREMHNVTFADCFSTCLFLAYP